MRTHIYALLILSFGLTGCKKEMSPQECQKNYDRININCDACIEAAQEVYASGLITLQEMGRRINKCEADANSEARTYDECCCWMNR